MATDTAYHKKDFLQFFNILYLNAKHYKKILLKIFY